MELGNRPRASQPLGKCSTELHSRPEVLSPLGLGGSFSECGSPFLLSQVFGLGNLPLGMIPDRVTC